MGSLECAARVCVLVGAIFKGITNVLCDRSSTRVCVISHILQKAHTATAEQRWEQEKVTIEQIPSARLDHDVLGAQSKSTEPRVHLRCWAARVASLHTVLLSIQTEI